MVKPSIELRTTSRCNHLQRVDVIMCSALIPAIVLFFQVEYNTWCTLQFLVLYLL